MCVDVGVYYTRAILTAPHIHTCGRAAIHSAENYFNRPSPYVDFKNVYNGAVLLLASSINSSRVRGAEEISFDLGKCNSIYQMRARARCVAQRAIRAALMSPVIFNADVVSA